MPGNNVSVLPFTRNYTVTAAPGSTSANDGEAAAGAEPASATRRADGSRQAPLVGALLGALGVGGLAVLGLRVRRTRR